MAELYYPFDSAADDRRQYPSSFLAAVIEGIVGDGIIVDGGSQLVPTVGAGLSINAAEGQAFVQGRHYRNTDTLNVPLTAADPTNDRIDRIVVRLNNTESARTIETVAVTGTPAATPVPPALTRSGGVWELSLCQVYVATGAVSLTSAELTDERSDSNLCGFIFRREAEGTEFGFNFIIEGGGGVISTGEKGFLEIPFDLELQEVRLFSDVSGSIVVDLWVDTYANFPPTSADSICAANDKPEIVSARKSEKTSLVGWTNTLSKGSILAFNVDSVTNIERLTVSLRGVRTLT